VHVPACSLRHPGEVPLRDMPAVTRRGPFASFPGAPPSPSGVGHDSCNMAADERSCADPTGVESLIYVTIVGDAARASAPSPTRAGRQYARVSEMHASAHRQGREGQGQSALALSGLWLSIHARHARRETLVADGSGGVPRWSRCCPARVGEKVRRPCECRTPLELALRHGIRCHTETRRERHGLNVDEQGHGLKPTGINSGSGRLLSVRQAPAWTERVGVVRPHL